MIGTSGDGKLARLYEQLKAGQISRREFMERAVALGVALPVLTFVVNSLGMKGAAAAPAGSTKSAVAAAQMASTRPLAPDDQVRGAGGEIKMLQWQAVTTMSLHQSQGTKDQLGASLVTEPLMSYLPDGSLWPTLVKEVPTVENGGLSADLKTVTYNLLEGVLWSDGTPFTSADVVATYNWTIDPVNATVSSGVYTPIASVEAPDDLTVVITFKESSLAWYGPFTGTYWGAVLPKHVLDQGAEAANEILRANPIGTGPYKVDTFTENDQVILSINENYREANKPYYATVNIKGGGDAVSAARAVLETGDWDLAWNLQVEPAILNEMVANNKGKWIVAPGTSVERILINFSDPNKEVNGQRSEVNTPHPILSDLAVRQALAAASDRDTIATQFYSGPPGEMGTANILVGIPAYESTANSYTFDLDAAAKILDDAGWVLDGDVRKKDGVELSLTYSTTINAVRQKTQAVNKGNFEKIGFKIELQQVDAGIFFDSAEGNDQNAAHFYRDLEMYTNNASTPFPVAYMESWYGGENLSNIAQKENQWRGTNESRFHDAEYDAAFETLATETDPEAAAATFIKLNDIVISQQVIVPLVQRAAESYAIANKLNPDQFAGSPWETLYWNIANWNEVPV
jgi:peptide/nickel transport system substrate-binding protein